MLHDSDVGKRIRWKYEPDMEADLMQTLGQLQQEKGSPPTYLELN